MSFDKGTNDCTINAIKGLTHAIEFIKDRSPDVFFSDSAQHCIPQLINAATEIERLNNEVNILRRENVKLKAENMEPMTAKHVRIHERWTAILDAVAVTDAGKNILHRGMDIDTATDRAIYAISKTETDRVIAQRIAEAFQKAQPKAEQERDVNAGWSNHHPFDALASSGRSFLVCEFTHKPDNVARYLPLSTEIIDEVVRASAIHPQWPTDALHAVSILSEKSGDLTDAAVNYHYHDGDLEAIRHEAIQTGAMALRVLLNINKYKRPSDEK
ncbi:hypothetical protein ACF3VQ_01935 [Yersinia sp. HM-2024]|uniref:hypothetical protein n=1 Tax=Yersinia sp. HM-2024 TaxID=3344550 RepID=UPI00370DE08A